MEAFPKILNVKVQVAEKKHNSSWLILKKNADLQFEKFINVNSVIGRFSGIAKRQLKCDEVH